MKGISIAIFFLLGLSLHSCDQAGSEGEGNSANEDAIERVGEGNAAQEEHPELTCYFFFISDCPACRNNLPKVVDLAQRYADQGLEVIGVVSDPELDEDLLQETLETFGVKFEIQRDEDLQIARQHGATVTPQVFLYDASETLLYSGQFDNYYFELGRHRKNITETWLEDAIQAAQGNNLPKVSRTEPIGCVINFDYFSEG